jgi:eukaryotic-like serine/threonine-protein kinase
VATAVGTWCPTPTSLTLIRPLADSDQVSDPATFAESIQSFHSAPEPEIDDSTRFQPLRLFATGGQGLVYVAHDKQLGREVALKELKPRNSDRRLTRHRFIREAEITGSLEHPGIVPVYALGRHADGRPYYAMRLIQGRTMHDAVQHYYSPDLKVTPVDRNLLFRKLLQRFVSVCQTVAYAHSRGIIHRDLKPANVLLGQYGEALVADWGLARPFHPTDGCGSDPEIPVEPDPGDPPSNETMMGSALGTPAYMSPEQSEGRWDKVGPASDVYSLGATLFTILTGQAPMPKLPWAEAHRRIVNGEIPSPKQINPHAPRGLVAVCLKAMAIKAENRYHSALALSEDIEHWLADEPVSAEPEPLAERTQRWIRRHRTLVWAVCVLWITGGLALSVGLVVVNQERSLTTIAHHDTQTALDRTQSMIVDDWLGKQPQMSPEHKQFLANALSDYEKLAASTGRDPITRLAVVRAYRRVGEIRQRLGEQTEAKVALEEATSRVEQLNDSDEARVELARIHVAQGLLDMSAIRLELGITGESKRLSASAEKLVESAESHFAHALGLFKRLLHADPTNATRRRELAAAYNNTAAALLQLNRGHDAIAAYQSALGLYQELAAANSSDNDAARDLAKGDLAKGYEQLGECFSRQNQFEDAEANLRRAAEMAEQLVARVPEHLPFQENLASAAQRLGSVYDKIKHWDEAKHWLELAAIHFAKLVSYYPNVPEYRMDLAGVFNNLGRIELKNDDSPDVAFGHFDRALAVLKQLEQREAPVRCEILAKAAYAGRAEALSRTGRHDEAADAWAVAADAAPERGDIYRTEQAMQLLHLDRVVEAVAIAEEVMQAKGRCSDAVYNCACLFSQASALRPKSSDVYKQRAVQLLKEVSSLGYFKDPKNLKNLEEDVDLGPIRDWPDFQAFRNGLEK